MAQYPMCNNFTVYENAMIIYIDRSVPKLHLLRINFNQTTHVKVLLPIYKFENTAPAFLR